MVILSPNLPDPALRDLIQGPTYSSRVVFLHGSAFDDADLLRAAIPDASAVFLLSPGWQGSEQRALAADRASALRAASVRNCSEKPEIFASVFHPSMKTQLLSSGANHVMCVEELKMHVFCAAASMPGFTTLFVNLVKSVPSSEYAQQFAQERTKVMAMLPADRAVGAHPQAANYFWRHEYDWGRGMDIFPVRLPQRYEAMPFTDVAYDMFQQYVNHARLFGGHAVCNMHIFTAGALHYLRCGLTCSIPRYPVTSRDLSHLWHHDLVVVVVVWTVTPACCAFACGHMIA